MNNLNNNSTNTFPLNNVIDEITTNYRKKEENIFSKTFCYDLCQVVVPLVIVIGIFLIVIFLI